MQETQERTYQPYLTGLEEGDIPIDYDREPPTALKNKITGKRQEHESNPEKPLVLSRPVTPSAIPNLLRHKVRLKEGFVKPELLERQKETIYTHFGNIMHFLPQTVTRIILERHQSHNGNLEKQSLLKICTPTNLFFARNYREGESPFLKASYAKPRAPYIDDFGLGFPPQTQFMLSDGLWGYLDWINKSGISLTEAELAERLTCIQTLKNFVAYYGNSNFNRNNYEIFWELRDYINAKRTEVFLAVEKVFWLLDRSELKIFDMNTFSLSDIKLIRSLEPLHFGLKPAIALEQKMNFNLVLGKPEFYSKLKSICPDFYVGINLRATADMVIVRPDGRIDIIDFKTTLPQMDYAQAMSSRLYKLAMAHLIGTHPSWLSDNTFHPTSYGLVFNSYVINALSNIHFWYVDFKGQDPLTAVEFPEKDAGYSLQNFSDDLQRLIETMLMHNIR